MASKTTTLDITQLSPTSRPKPTHTFPSTTLNRLPTSIRKSTNGPSRPLTASTIALISLGSLAFLAILLPSIYFCICCRKKPTVTPEARAAQHEFLGRRERLPGGGYEIAPLYVEPPRRVEPAYVDAVGGYYAPGRNGNAIMR